MIRAAAALLVAVAVAGAQDTVATTRHILALDLARVRPFHRAYDVFVTRADSTYLIGERVVALIPAVLPDSSSGWLLTESRSGAVPASDSLRLASDLRPVWYTSNLGSARLELDFDTETDSATGAARVGRAAATIVAPVSPDLVVNGAMLDLLAGILPLTASFADSVAVLSADFGGARVVAAELSVLGDEPAATETLAGAWVLGLRAESRLVQLTVDKATGVVLRVQQSAPASVGTVVEYRLKAVPEAARQ